jgi:hypothetical protein
LSVGAVVWKVFSGRKLVKAKFEDGDGYSNGYIDRGLAGRRR